MFSGTQSLDQLPCNFARSFLLRVDQDACLCALFSCALGRQSLLCVFLGGARSRNDLALFFNRSDFSSASIYMCLGAEALFKADFWCSPCRLMCVLGRRV